MIIRGIFASTNIIIKYYALQVLPLADVVMITSTSTVFTVFFARIFLREKIVPADLLSVILIVSGLVFMAQPEFIFGVNGVTYNDPQILYTLLALIISSVLIGSNMVVILRVLKDVHWSCICTALGSIGFAITLGLTWIRQDFCLPASGLDRFLIVLIGLLTFGGQLTLVLLTKVETATFSALLRKTFDVILAFIFQLTIFQVSLQITIFLLYPLFWFYLGDAKRTENHWCFTFSIRHFHCKWQENHTSIAQKSSVKKSSCYRLFVQFEIKLPLLPLEIYHHQLPVQVQGKMSEDVFAAVSLRLQTFSNRPECLFTHCVSRRDANQDKMPVVFLPEKNTVECERVSRMSSWGFMSFVLAVINGVINISNNINSNNNNRNNNNNDQNSNQFNTNLGNTNNVQMAGGMAMSGRRLPALARFKVFEIIHSRRINIPYLLHRLWEIREKFKRKMERQLSPVEQSSISTSPMEQQAVPDPSNSNIKIGIA